MSEKPKYAVDDYLAIKRRMEELAYERDVANQRPPEAIPRVYHCEACDSSGWRQSKTTSRWRICTVCDNPLGKAKPF